MDLAAFPEASLASNIQQVKIQKEGKKGRKANNLQNGQQLIDFKTAGEFQFFPRSERDSGVNYTFPNNSLKRISNYHPYSP